MNKLNIYGFNIHALLVLLLLVGCGNTPIKPGNAIEIINRNSVTLIASEFKLTKLKGVADFDQLPKELAHYKNQMGHFDFYLAQSPTQNSGGFVFEAVQNSDPLVICLKKPGAGSIVTTALANPISLVMIQKGLIVEMRISYCDQ